MVEARYNGTKVVGVSPDYAEYDKFADIWLPAKAGTDGALAMAMTRVILKEFYVNKQTPYFKNYVKQYTDSPHLVLIDESEKGTQSGRFLSASDLGKTQELGDWKTAIWDDLSNRTSIPNGSQGFRWDNTNKWNPELKNEKEEQIDPKLSFLDNSDEVMVLQFPYFAEKEGETVERGVPVKHVIDKKGNTLKVTTVYDLMMAHTGVDRGLPGDYSRDYDDPKPYTPAWQEKITGVKRSHAIQVLKESTGEDGLTMSDRRRYVPLKGSNKSPLPGIG